MLDKGKTSFVDSVTFIHYSQVLMYRSATTTTTTTTTSAALQVNPIVIYLKENIRSYLSLFHCALEQTSTYIFSELRNILNFYLTKNNSLVRKAERT
jgi:outer membrane lipoprotein-sorting protein